MANPPKLKIFARDDGLFSIGVLMPAIKLTTGKEDELPVYCTLNDSEDNPLAGCFMSREAAQAAIDAVLAPRTPEMR